MMDWDSLSEVVFGLMLKGKISSDAVRSTLFVPPFDEAVTLFKTGKTSTEYMIGKIGLTPVQAALEAASTVNGNKIEWVAMLEKSATENMVAGKLEKIAKSLRKGDAVQHTEVIEQLNLLSGDQTACIRMDEVQDDPDPFLPIGMPAIDDHLIGLGKAGLSTIGGPPGSGKTSLATNILKCFLKTYPTKTAAMFTLEMRASEFKTRAVTANSMTEEEQHRLFIVDEIMPVDQVTNTIARLKDEDLGMAIIDFADLMIADESNESEMAKIYRMCAQCAKRINIPVILLSQLSRSYTGGMPRPFNLRYTSMAEALSWSIFMLYNPMTDFRSESQLETLPSVDGTAYIIAWKHRGGFRLHGGQPGAISLPFSSKAGWGTGSKSTWFKVKGE